MGGPKKGQEYADVIYGLWMVPLVEIELIDLQKPGLPTDYPAHPSPTSLNGNPNFFYLFFY